MSSIELVVASIGSPLLPALIAFLSQECLGTAAGPSGRGDDRNDDTMITIIYNDVLSVIPIRTRIVIVIDSENNNSNKHN